MIHFLNMLKLTNEDKPLEGPSLYERYNKIAILCQQKYFRSFKLQIIVMSFIAFLSLFPPFSETQIDIKKHSLELILIIFVLSIMIWQYNANYTKGWENARYLAESILSNAWLFVWKCEPFDDDQNPSMKFIDMIENIEKQIDLKQFLSLVPPHKNEISDWMNNLRDADLELKKVSTSNIASMIKLIGIPMKLPLIRKEAHYGL